MTTNGTMANSSKKRKASELDPDHNDRPSKSKVRPRPKRSKNDSKITEDIPFTPECPYKPSSQPDDDVYVQKEEIAPGFEFEYAVRPGMQWKNMRSYRNVKLQDHMFSVGMIIYINKQVPPPKSPPPDATEAEILKWDRTNFWVGRIADTRAETDKAVFLRVYWLYWPEELPMGRQPYHGDRELILSNAMDIVDAQTISGAADLSYWDEQEDSSQQHSDRFWRQFFDVSQLGKDRKGGLSELRRHCTCHEPHNPDRAMFQCKQPGCMIWNHEECLVEGTLRRIWTVYEKNGHLDSIDVDAIKAEENEGEHSLRQRLMSPVRQLGKIVQNTITPAVNAVIEQSVVHSTGGTTNGNPTPSKKVRPMKKTARSVTPAPPPWEGRLRVQIIDSDDKDDESPVYAKVHEVFGKKTKSDAKSWLVRVNCLVCQHVM